MNAPCMHRIWQSPAPPEYLQWHPCAQGVSQLLDGTNMEDDGGSLVTNLFSTVFSMVI